MQIPRLIGELICFGGFREWLFADHTNEEIKGVLTARGYSELGVLLKVISAWKAAGYVEVSDPYQTSVLPNISITNPVKSSFGTVEGLIERVLLESGPPRFCPTWPCTGSGGNGS